MKPIKDSFWQLITIYATFVLAIALGFLGRYTLYFNVFALIIAIFGFMVLKTKVETNEFSKKTNYAILGLAAFLLFFFRLFPYWFNNVRYAIGYDAGFYRYMIEYGLVYRDDWVVGNHEPLFHYIMFVFHKILNLSSDFLLTYGYIAAIAILGGAIYFFTQTYTSRKDVAAVATLIYAISLVQFTVFTYLYYKNVLALALLLFAFTALEKKQLWKFTVLGIAIGALHRPTFFIFGLAYLAFTIIAPYKELKPFKKLLLYALHGAIILLGSMFFYLGDFSPIITDIINPLLGSFAQPGLDPGTFISFFTYQFAILPYLPLALLGFFFTLNNKRHELRKDIFAYYTVFLAIIVYFQFFFFNRFIIFLDIALIIFASIGAIALYERKTTWATLLLTILFLASVIMTFQAAQTANTILPQSTIDAMTVIDIPTSNSYIISPSSQYSPYLQGYAGSALENPKTYKIIAPGLFDYDIWATEARWQQYWTDWDAGTLQGHYGLDTDIYLFTDQELNEQQQECYRPVQKYLYRWRC